MERLATWSPDGTRIAFFSEQGLAWIAADGSGEAEVLLAHEALRFPSSWTPDGRNVVFFELHPSTSRDIWVLPVEGDRSPKPVLVTEFSQHSAAVSPDGRWLAYVSDESGRAEVYVQPYPGPGAKHLVSVDGGANPLWSADGREIFYRQGNRILSVVIETEPELTVAAPDILFEGPFRSGLTGTRNYNYDVAPDGRFLMMKTDQDSGPTELNVVLNWTEELKRLVPKEH